MKRIIYLAVKVIEHYECKTAITYGDIKHYCKSEKTIVSGLYVLLTSKNVIVDIKGITNLVNYYLNNDMYLAR